MVSYSRRLQSGHITCYLNRTYDVLLTRIELQTSGVFVYRLTVSAG